MTGEHQTVRSGFEEVSTVPAAFSQEGQHGRVLAAEVLVRRTHRGQPRWKVQARFEAKLVIQSLFVYFLEGTPDIHLWVKMLHSIVAERPCGQVSICHIPYAVPMERRLCGLKGDAYGML